MTKGIFITATGTDVGKTYISGLIVKNLRKHNFNCGYYKPVLSGAVIEKGNIIPGDCAYVFNQANIDKIPKDYVSYIFTPAVSPHLAAEKENINIKFSKIQEDINRIQSEYDYILVEGAGGIICPLNMAPPPKRLMLTDIIKNLNLNIIIVASAELGTINSTVLTAEYAKQNGIKIKGIILNKFNEDDSMHLDNKKQIETLTGIKIIATVKTGGNTIDINNILPTFEEI